MLMIKGFRTKIAAAYFLTLIPPSVPTLAQSFPFKKCHLETGKEKRVLGTLDWTVTVLNCEVSKWIIFMPTAPTLDGQTAPKSSLFSENNDHRATTSFDRSSAKRDLMELLISDNSDKHRLTGSVKYQAILAPRTLVSGSTKEGPSALSSAEEKLYLSQSEHLNFNDPRFQKWLDDKTMRKGQESDLQFAWRAFSTLRNTYTYSYSNSQDRHVVRLCQESSTDCGGLSWLFVAVLRANGVPARSLVGRWAKSAEADEVGSGEAHVKSEFFAKDIGWIPVEMSGAVTNKPSDPLKYFGRDRGNFITFHIDPDLVIDTRLFGNKVIRNIQSPAVWVSGQGSVKGIRTHAKWTCF